MHSENNTARLRFVAVGLGAFLVVGTTTPLFFSAGCDNTVEKVTGSTSSGSSSASSGSSGSSSTTDMCTGAASIDGDGSGCLCGANSCGMCLPCPTCNTSSNCPMSNLTCVHADHQCGQGIAGECIQPQGGGTCDPNSPRVCVCTGDVTSQDCATKQGLDVSDDNTHCFGGVFTCGDKSCLNYQEYCRVVSGGPAGSMPSYTCVSAPQTCVTGIVGCDCVNEPGAMCSIDANNQILVQILAP